MARSANDIAPFPSLLPGSNFGDATISPEASGRIRRTFENKIDPNTVAVVTGFIAHDSEGRITTLGRGGSDLTATAIGAACSLDEVQVWKDVDGIMSCDPRMVKNAVPIEKVSFEEASELAYFGAKVRRKSGSEGSEASSERWKRGANDGSEERCDED